MSEQKLRAKMERELLGATRELARIRDEFYIKQVNKPMLPSEENKLIALPLVIEVLMRLMKE
jgi:hypothetical protein